MLTPTEAAAFIGKKCIVTWVDDSCDYFGQEVVGIRADRLILKPIDYLDADMGWCEGDGEEHSVRYDEILAIREMTTAERTPPGKSQHRGENDEDRYQEAWRAAFLEIDPHSPSMSFSKAIAQGIVAALKALR